MLTRTKLSAAVMALGCGLVAVGAVPPAAAEPPPPASSKSDKQGGGSSVKVQGQTSGKPGNSSRSGGGRSTNGGGSRSGSGGGGGPSMTEWWNSNTGETKVAPSDQQPPGFSGRIIYTDPDTGGGQGGGAPQEPAIDPGVAAQRAVAQLNLHATPAELSPDWNKNPYKMLAVGFPVWVSASRASLTSQTAKDSVEGLAVSLDTGTPTVTVAMGDGTTLSCATNGRPWTPNRDKPGADGPCSHAYTQRGNYTVTTTYTWNVTWTAGGTSGTIPVTETTTTPIPIGELQTVLTDGN